MGRWRGWTTPFVLPDRNCLPLLFKVNGKMEVVFMSWHNTGRVTPSSLTFPGPRSRARRCYVTVDYIVSPAEADFGSEPGMDTGMLLNILAVIWMVGSPSVGGNPEVAGGVSQRHHQQDDAGNYQFGYQVRDPTSHQFRRESGDAYGRVVGSYGLSEADGRHRIVDYVADQYGFRARVRTNEPGTGGENSAAVRVSQPGHPPAPPPVAHPVASLPAASGRTGDWPVKSALPARPYSYPYYYWGLAQPPAPQPWARADPGPALGRGQLSDSEKYDQRPASGRRYAAPLPEAAPARFQLATADRLSLAGGRLPANYRVEPIPNGIRAVPVDSSDSGGGVYSPYPSAPDGPYSGPAYPSTRPGYPDPAVPSYAYPSTDYRFSGSGRSPTVDRLSQTVDR